MEISKHGLRRELRLRDLVLMQVVLIMGASWVGFTAKQGATHAVLWLLAILLFYLPLAAVVMRLSRAMPMEGGVYQWVRAGISPFAGYMAAWSVTLYTVTAFATIGSSLASGVAYCFGPGGAWMATDNRFALAVTAFCCLLALGINVRGLQVAKWVSSGGSVLQIAVFGMLAVLLARALPAARGAFALAWPGFSVLSLNVLSKMAVGALSGFDNSAVFAEECRRPGNDVAKSVMIAAPMIAAMYVLGTAAVLAYTPAANVDLAAPVAQVLHAGFGGGALGNSLTVASVAAVNLGLLAGMVMLVGMVARLPMVAGWDGLLPAWWSELHPRFRTPAKAILAVTTTLMALGALSLWGAGNQEAVQVSGAVGIVSLCVMYMLLFSVIVFARRPAGRPGWGIRLAALAAFVVALVSLVFQIVPLGEVASPAVFAAKVVGVALAAYGLGTYLYWRRVRRLRRGQG